ncbi:hypothetical protein Dimus_021721 [Dionaea muscipula]
MMASPSRNKSVRGEPLNVTPLNSIPYIDPHNTNVHSVPNSSDGSAGPDKKGQPALLYFPSEPTEDEWKKLLSIKSSGVILTGSAAMGALGPVLGKMDIAESEESYLFRVSLPGVAREDFTCDVAPNGQILMKGVTTTGERIAYKESMKFEMQTQHLCPPGHFSISFPLPGPVDSQQLTAHFGIDGIFEGLVKKKKK